MIQTSPTQPVFRPYAKNLDLLETVKPVEYRSSLLPGGVLVIGSGFLTDGASIPAGLWWLTGDPFLPRYQLATLLHDYLYRYRHGSQKAADDLFLALLKKNGVGRFRRSLMWGALRAVGWLYWRRNL
jgi:hypothetical protein